MAKGQQEVGHARVRISSFIESGPSDDDHNSTGHRSSNPLRLTTRAGAEPRDADVARHRRASRLAVLSVPSPSPAPMPHHRQTAAWQRKKPVHCLGRPADPRYHGFRMQ
jgi:hypothetical protein